MSFNILLSHKESWKLMGNCRNEDPDLFFTLEGVPENSKFNKRRISRAKSICHTCPVSGNCLDAGLSITQEGIWGGMTERERRLITRRGSRVRCVRCNSKDRTQDGNSQVCLHCGLSWLV